MYWFAKSLINSIKTKIVAHLIKFKSIVVRNLPNKDEENGNDNFDNDSSFF